MSEEITVYWNGFETQAPLIQDLPEEIDIVNLFLLNIAASENGTTLKENFISSGSYSWAQILDQAATARSQLGFKVCVTIMSPKGKLMWNTIPDANTFAKNVYDLVVGWGLDGIDIDPEQGKNGSIAPNSTFIEVVEALSKYFGPASGTGLRMSIATYVLENDRTLLSTTAPLFDAVLLMGYFWALDEMESQFEAYAEVVDASQLSFGVAPNKTSIDDAGQLAAWEPASGQKGGMMEFNVNIDAPAYAMVSAIVDQLPK